MIRYKWVGAADAHFASGRECVLCTCLCAYEMFSGPARARARNLDPNVQICHCTRGVLPFGAPEGLTLFLQIFALIAILNDKTRGFLSIEMRPDVKTRMFCASVFSFCRVLPSKV